MDLSVIIVNYNVKYFLEQCLHSVMKAAGRIHAEVFVVDNNSADGSVTMVAEKFPDVRLIANNRNAGFACANNQAIKMASGRYILLLNPDTVVQEDTFVRCIEFLDNHPDAGSLGVKMIDGKGKFLPESKRALPTPLVAFFKVFGLSRLFPRSRRFARYHLGYLNRDEIHRVDVLSGAYMMIRKEALEKAGLLDEEFFMYGEDIDLSYRIIQAGYHNYYFPKTTIIHYKGESTRKSSINYVIVFYRAMIIFARKHFNHRTFRYYSLFINLAIYFRAGISIFSRFVSGIITPLADSLAVYGGYLLFLPVWENYHFGQAGYYPPAFMHIAVPVYIAIWLSTIFLTTGYEKKVKLYDLLRGVLFGSLVILVIYALIPEHWRFSRLLILAGSIWLLISVVLIRYLLSVIAGKNFSFEIFRKKKRIILIGEKEEACRVYALIKQSDVYIELTGIVNPAQDVIDKEYLGHLGQIDEIVRINGADELIFCSASVTSQQIIMTMLHFTETDLEFKIAPPESMSVIGSSSNETAGELYVLHFNTLSRLLNRRKKRLLDFLVAFFFIPALPLMLLIVKRPAGFLGNIGRVLLGFASWVGYYSSTGGNHPGLPLIKPGVLTPLDGKQLLQPTEKIIEQENLLYAKDYRILRDLRIILRNLNLLGRPTVVSSERD